MAYGEDAAPVEGLRTAADASTAIYAVTVGERGQVCIPKQLRRDLHLVTHQKLLVFSHPTARGVLLLAQIDDWDNLAHLGQFLEPQGGEQHCTAGG
jgi:hypothetical protein